LINIDVNSWTVTVKNQYKVAKPSENDGIIPLKYYKMNGQAEVEVDYKRKYKNLKRKLKFIVYVSIVFFSV